LKNNFTPAEYLAMEEVADYKSEYYAGEIFAMTGGSADHSTVAVNLTSEMQRLLASRPCQYHFNASGRRRSGRLSSLP